VTQLHDTGKRNGQPGQPKPGHPRAPVSTGLPKPAAPSPIADHAKQIMLELVRHRANYTAEAVAAESFKLARAFAAEAAKEKPGESSDG
jgi:hypothetical protein